MLLKKLISTTCSRADVADCCASRCCALPCALSTVSLTSPVHRTVASAACTDASGRSCPGSCLPLLSPSPSDDASAAAPASPLRSLPRSLCSAPTAAARSSPPSALRSAPPLRRGATSDPAASAPRAERLALLGVPHAERACEPRLGGMMPPPPQRSPHAPLHPPPQLLRSRAESAPACA
eukprot:3035190-Pleurochrysis_carterae.AAC.1